MGGPFRVRVPLVVWDFGVLNGTRQKCLIRLGMVRVQSGACCCCSSRGGLRVASAERQARAMSGNDKAHPLADEEGSGVPTRVTLEYGGLGMLEVRLIGVTVAEGKRSEERQRVADSTSFSVATLLSTRPDGSATTI